MDPIRHIACLAFAEVMSLDVTGPLQVFASANVERQGLPPSYALHKRLSVSPQEYADRFGHSN